MALRQLTPGVELDAPVGPLRIRLDAPAGVRLELRDEQGASLQPSHRMSATEVIVVPTGRTLLIGAVVSGHPFPPDTLVGMTIAAAAGTGDEVVRPRADVGGRSFAPLVRYTPGSIPKLNDAFETRGENDRLEPFIPRTWHRVGNYAYHTHHDDFSQARVGWSLVLDGSASMLISTPRPQVGALLEVLVGVLGAAMGSAPASAMVADYPDPRDVKALLAVETPDWDVILGDDPSPWARVLPSLERATAGLDDEGLAVLVVDGMPVDLAEVEQWVITTRRRLLVVTLGRSRFEYAVAFRPTQAWDDELQALATLAAQPSVTVASVSGLAGVTERAVEFADALFPVGGGVR